MSIAPKQIKFRKVKITEAVAVTTRVTQLDGHDRLEHTFVKVSNEQSRPFATSSANDAQTQFTLVSTHELRRNPYNKYLIYGSLRFGKNSMSQKQENECVQGIMTQYGETRAQALVTHCECVLAWSLNSLGTFVLEARQGRDVTLHDLSNPLDFSWFIAEKIADQSDTTKEWLLSTVPDLCYDINQDSNEQVTCVSKADLAHLIFCIRKLGDAVDAVDAGNQSF